MVGSKNYDIKKGKLILSIGNVSLCVKSYWSAGFAEAFVISESILGQRFIEIKPDHMTIK